MIQAYFLAFLMDPIRVLQPSAARHPALLRVVASYLGSDLVRTPRTAGECADSTDRDCGGSNVDGEAPAPQTRTSMPGPRPFAGLDAWR